jgi:hypothetical protein
MAYECPSEWRDKVVVSHDVNPERSVEEIRERIIQKLISWGVRIALPEPDVIDGEADDVQTVGVARITGRTKIGGRRRVLG